MNQLPKSDNEVNELLNRLVSSTHSPQGRFTADKSFNILEKKLLPRKYIFRPYQYISAAAAIVLILGFSWMFYYNTQSVSIKTISTLAEIKKIKLPDGTQVILDRYSSIQFPETFKEKIRNVNLLGKAYFEVTKNPAKPFIVETQSVNIQVLGTHFNVDAYKDDPSVTTTLLEGSVVVTNKKQNRKLILKPDETAIYSKLSATFTHLKKVDAEKDIAWSQGILLFNSAPMQEIALTLSHRFNIKIEIDDTFLRRHKFTARFDNQENLYQILDLLKSTGNFSYQKVDNKIKIQLKQN